VPRCMKSEEGGGGGGGREGGEWASLAGYLLVSDARCLFAARAGNRRNERVHTNNNRSPPTCSVNRCTRSLFQNFHTSATCRSRAASAHVRKYTGRDKRSPGFYFLTIVSAVWHIIGLGLIIIGATSCLSFATTHGVCPASDACRACRASAFLGVCALTWCRRALPRHAVTSRLVVA
jgi:hypothetical protein